MMKNKNIFNITKSVYFYGVITLSLTILLWAGQNTVDLVTDHSLQLSSNMTPAPEMSSTEQYYDLQLSLSTDYTVIMDSSLAPITLHAGDEVSVSVPLSALNGITDPNKVNLSSVVSKIPKDPSGFFPGRNEVTIQEARDEKAKPYIGESAKMELLSLLSNHHVMLKSIKESEEEESDEVDTEAKVCINCISGSTPQPPPSTLDLLIKKLYSGSARVINSIEDAVKSFVNSDMNKKLLAKIKSGFTMRLGATYKVGRQITLRDGVESPFHRKCLRGVKMALWQSGVFSDYPGEERAKKFGAVLEKHGYMNLMNTSFRSQIKTPCDAPPGSVLVYSGGKSGHAEIRTEKGFMSDYFSKDSRIGCSSGLAARGRQLTGVYIAKTPEMKSLADNNRGSKNERTN
jgi:hypothetical protein